MGKHPGSQGVTQVLSSRHSLRANRQVLTVSFSSRKDNQMKALCWHGKDDVRIDTVPDPKIEEPRDCHRQDHLHRHLRLGPAPLRRLHADDGGGRRARPRVHGRGGRGRDRRSRKLKVGDRVVVPFTIACGECFFCKKGLTSLLRPLEPERRRWPRR